MIMLTFLKLRLLKRDSQQVNEHFNKPFVKVFLKNYSNIYRRIIFVSSLVQFVYTGIPLFECMTSSRKGLFTFCQPWTFQGLFFVSRFFLSPCTAETCFRCIFVTVSNGIRGTILSKISTRFGFFKDSLRLAVSKFLISWFAKIVLEFLYLIVFTFAKVVLYLEFLFFWRNLMIINQKLEVNNCL